jgi:hypothetical protein
VVAVKPEGGTPAHREWVLAQVVATAEALDVPVAELSRDAFRTFQAALRPGCSHTDVEKSFGSWSALKNVATGRAGGVAAPLDVLPKGHGVRGVSTYVSADGTIKGQWVKTRSNDDQLRQAWLEQAIAELPTWVPVADPVPMPHLDQGADILAVIPWGDPHLGMRAWIEECGDNFDLKIAEDLYGAAFDAIARRGTPARTALLINVGDALHADDSTERTPRGKHPLDVDGRHPLIVRVAVRVFVRAIRSLLGAHERVIVDMLAGNHDPHSAHWLAAAIEGYFTDEPRVEIIHPVESCHFHEWGDCLIGTTHGDEVRNPAELPGIMASQARQQWGAAKFCHFWVGHLHHKWAIQSKDYQGVTVEHVRTLAARDAYAARKGYSSPRDIWRIAYHKHFGEIDRFRVSEEYLRTAYLEHRGAA